MLAALALVAGAGFERAPTAALSFGRRHCVTALAAASVPSLGRRPARAFVAGSDEETSGLVLLRVAEVCQFQEKLLRTIALCAKPDSGNLTDQFGLPYCDGQTYSVNPSQILFGTGLLLRNSNLDGNMKLMIRDEVPRKQKDAAIRSAVGIMNTFNRLSEAAQKCQDASGSFSTTDLVEVADIYADARNQLARFFDYLPQPSQDRFYNFADSVRQYEEKMASADGIERMKL